MEGEVVNTGASEVPVSDGGSPNVNAGGDGTQQTAPPVGDTGSTQTAVWTDTLSSDLQNYVQTKGFKDPATVLESYINLEKLRGVPQDRLLKLPEGSDSPEWKDVYQKLGTPESPEGYEFTSDDETNEAVSWASETFHELNLTKAQGQTLMEKFEEFNNSVDVEGAEAYKVEVANQELELKKEWGTAYHQNIATAQKAAQTFGLPGEGIDALEQALGYDGVMKFLANVGSKLGEANFVSGESRDGFGESLMTPEMARAKIKAITQDPKGEMAMKWAAGDFEVKEKMSKLHKMAYPDS